MSNNNFIIKSKLLQSSINKNLPNFIQNKLISDKKEILEKSLTEKFTADLKTKEEIIKLKDEELAFRIDMKKKLSTKMIGESLEIHCENEFNKLRSTAFPTASCAFSSEYV